ncbi:MafI family immunity protein [Erwinia sp. MMLR14_017]|uniref:MafI family immunity protein n=1 Tax=Erwinia sp. MMLR14_017 TaxID=3093842 RepID=UPI00298F4AB0|nr:MafI family immunity protein [Erwinia sp. MMLR14_017]MDW8848447.1 MafI family immunity protein [Erwinia sp. MMLR14_017]
MFSEKINQLGKALEDRLNPALVEGALDYIQHNEEPLAFEILCDHISEYDISITSEEYELITSLVEDMRLDINAAPFKYMKSLVI